MAERPSDSEIAWAAGLFEGEGSIVWVGKRERYHRLKKVAHG